MSLAQHLDAKLRFDQQIANSGNDVLPFIIENLKLPKEARIIEVGCGEGGVLVPFLIQGYHCVGVELQPYRVELANHFLAEFIEKKEARLVNKNIYDLDFLGEFKGQFDLIILKDAIEHIPDQEKLIGYLKKLLKPKGAIFFGFPPWYMPFGGHQQICKNKYLSKLAYMHLLPVFFYKKLLQWGGEKENTIQELLEIKETGISIERFEKICRHHHFKFLKKRFYFINPIYKYKFGLKPRIQNPIIARIPFFRNFVTTCVYYLISPED